MKTTEEIIDKIKDLASFREAKVALNTLSGIVVNEYPKDCLHLKDITLYESGKLVLTIHDVSKRFTEFCGLHQFMDGHETCPTCIELNK